MAVEQMNREEVTGMEDELLVRSARISRKMNFTNEGVGKIMVRKETNIEAIKQKELFWYGQNEEDKT